MSMNPTVNFGYGLALYGYDNSLAYSFAEFFPKVAEEFQDEYGEIEDITGFLYEVSDSREFFRKYPELEIHFIAEDYAIVVEKEATVSLYDKYDAPSEGVFLPQEQTYSKKDLKQFSKDLGILEKTQEIIWTTWG